MKKRMVRKTTRNRARMAVKHVQRGRKQPLRQRPRRQQRKQLRVQRTRKVVRNVVRRQRAMPRPQVRKSTLPFRQPVATQQQPLSTEQLQETFIGTVRHYYTHLGVCILEIAKKDIAVGDKIHIKGATTDYVQEVQSLQLDKESIARASPGQSVGLKVDQHVREHDKVYKC